jgi:malate permease and related proteins
MNALLLIAVCFLLGIACARIGRLPEGLPQSLNWWVLNVALPALVLNLIPRMHFNSQLWFLVVAMWFVFLGAWLLMAGLGRFLGWSRARIGALILVAGLGNTAFTGYPLIEALRGQEALTLAVVADQLGCFLALAVGGIAAAAAYSGTSSDAKATVRRVLTFPPFQALILSVAVLFLGGWPAPLQAVLERLGDTLAPVALFSIGLQFSLQLSRSQFGAVAVALGWKLVTAPLLVLLFGITVGIHGAVLAVGVLQAGMSPMISSAILADQYGLDPKVAHASLGAGILISLVTVPMFNVLV